MSLSARPYSYFFFSLLLALVLSAWLSLESSVWWVVCSALVLLAGLPHGAYDMVIMRDRHKGARLVAMLFGYLALVGAVIALWVLEPLVLLVCFLAYSAYHFGDSDFANATYLHKVSWGSSIVGLPALMSNSTVTALFTVLTGPGGVATLVNGLALFGLVAVLTHIYGARQRVRAAALLATYALVCWAAGALVAFTCYFVCFHSPLHLQHWRRKVGVNGAGTIYGLSLLVIGVVAGVIWAASLGQPTTFDIFDDITLRYTFVAIAALTVPHMTLLVIENVRRRRT